MSLLDLCLRSIFGGRVLLWAVLGVSLVRASQLQLDPSTSVHAFYYLWYGEPNTDGAYKHWNHEVLPHWDQSQKNNYPYGTRFTPPGNIHSPFYPLRGPYSSRDKSVIREHAQELLEAGVDVIAVSWWGPSWRSGTHDTQGVNTDEVLGSVIHELEQLDSQLEVAIHMEPYPGRTAASTREDLGHLMKKYSNSTALLRIDGKPLYYVYDSYHIPASDWKELLGVNGSNTIRGTEMDGVFLGLWVEADDGNRNIAAGGFDGFYTYFASEAVSYGSQPQNWPALASWAKQHQKLFVASIGPGYDDSRIRPWNAGATRDREGGERYKWYWEQATQSGACGISITSFNEWGEGTQIEAAKPWEDLDSGHQFQDYGPEGPQLYMQLTGEYAKKFKAHHNEQVQHPLRQEQEEEEKREQQEQQQQSRTEGQPHASEGIGREELQRDIAAEACAAPSCNADAKPEPGESSDLSVNTQMEL